MKKLAYIFLTLFLTLSCGKDTSNTSNAVNRAAILDNLGNIIMQRYTQLKADADSLNIYADSFQTNTTAQNFSLLQNAYIKTYKTFQTIQYFNFGKAEELELIEAFNFYPEDTTIILNAIQNNSYNIQTIANKAKGLQALDYLLYGIRNYNSTEVLNWFSNTPNATAYVKSIAEEIKRITDLVYNDWNDNYLTEFKNKQGIEASSSFFIMTNAIIGNFEKLGRTGKVGVPLGYNGIFSGDIPRLELIEARHSKISIALMKIYVESFEEFLKGENGLGYDDYLNTIGAKFNNSTPLSTVINTKLNDLKNKINAIEEPYATEIVDNRQKVVETFQAFQQLVITLKVDVSSAMSIDIIYQDSDGD